MAKRGPKGPHKGQIKPGEVRNPGGRPALTAEQRAIRAVTPEGLSRYISKYLYLPLETLRVAAADETTLPAIEVLICRHILLACEGDIAITRELLDRCCGKVKEQVVVSPNRDAEVEEALLGIPEKNVIEFLRSTVRNAAA